ncbi:MAG: DCC1-like thiol-disulfide oxidoreductase family protein [Candidatus Acidiferrales bacterium]
MVRREYMVAADKLAGDSRARLDSSAPRAERIFYDGHCGLCHRAVRFVIARDPQGRLFRYTPLQGTKFAALVSVERRAGLPDSVVVLTDDGRLLIRSDAFIHILRRLGGFWRFVAGIIGVIPRVVRDGVYDFIAQVRYRIFGRRAEVCPVTPPELRARFDE